MIIYSAELTSCRALQPSVTRLTSFEWSLLRGAMGKPRRLSPAYLRCERSKLEKYRQDVCLVQSGQVLRDVDLFPYDVPAPVVVGQRVTAIHPETALLHGG